MAHIAALRALPDGPPVGVTVFVEGEEEIGSDSLLTILERHSEKLRADAIVLADSGNWAIGEPALTATLRGLIRVVVTITTLDHGVHSGMFGGPCPTPSPPSSASSPPSTTRRQPHRRGAEVRRGVRPRLRRGAAAPRVRPPRRGPDDRVGLDPHPALEQAVADDHRVQRAERRAVVQHAGPLGLGQAVDAHRARRGHPGGLRAAGAPPREAPAMGRADGDLPRRRGRRGSTPTRTARSTTRPAPPSPTRGVSSRSTSGPAGRSRSWRGSPRCSPTPRSS